MKNKVIFMQLVLIVLMVVIVLTKVEADTTDYLFPLTVGNWLQFSNKDKGSDYGIKLSVIGTADFSGTEAYIVQIEETEPDDIDLEFMFSAEIDGVFYSYDTDGLSAAFLRGSAGTQWTYIEIDGDFVTVTIQAIEEVTVPSGIFSGCYHYVKEAYDDGVLDYSWEEWVHPGTGLVKFTEDTHKSNPVTYELTDYYIQ